MSGRMRRVIAVASVMAFAFDSNSALGQTSPLANVRETDRDMARVLARQAFNEFDAGRYLAAVERFDKAIVLFDAPTLRLGRGEAHAALRNLVLAAADFRAAASHRPIPDEPSSFAPARQRASLKYGEIQARVPRITIVVKNVTPLVTLNGKTLGMEQLNSSLLLDPGSHEVVFLHGGHRTTETLVLEEGANELLEFKATTVPISSPSQDSPPPTEPPITATVVSAALIAGTVVFALIGNRAWSDFEASDTSRARDSQRESDRSSAMAWTWATAGMGAAALASTGVTVYLWLNPSASSTARAEQASGHSLTGVSAGITGTF